MTFYAAYNPYGTCQPNRDKTNPNLLVSFAEQPMRDTFVQDDTSRRYVVESGVARSLEIRVLPMMGMKRSFVPIPPSAGAFFAVPFIEDMLDPAATGSSMSGLPSLTLLPAPDTQSSDEAASAPAAQVRPVEWGQWQKGISADAYRSKTDPDGIRRYREGNFWRQEKGGGLQIIRVRYWARQPFKAMKVLLAKLQSGEDITALDGANLN